MADEPEPRPDRCETCRFWEKRTIARENLPKGHPDQQGICHRYPPVLNLEMIRRSLDIGIDEGTLKESPDVAAIEEAAHFAAWMEPHTTASSWCGEWQEKNGSAGIPVKMLAEVLLFSEPLSMRSKRCLAKRGITTVGDLIQATEDDLLEIKHLGCATLDNICKFLASRGLALKPKTH